jgi:hypothetical protein
MYWICRFFIASRSNCRHGSLHKLRILFSELPEMSPDIPPFLFLEDDSPFPRHPSTRETWVFELPQRFIESFDNISDHMSHLVSARTLDKR